MQARQTGALGLAFFERITDNMKFDSFLEIDGVGNSLNAYIIPR